jgi:hypothetical protein
MDLVLVPGLGQLSKDRKNFLAKYGRGWTVYSLALGNGTPGNGVASPPPGPGNGRLHTQALRPGADEGRSRPCHAARRATRSPAWGYAPKQLDIMAVIRSRGLGARPEPDRVAQLGRFGSVRYARTWRRPNLEPRRTTGSPAGQDPTLLWGRHRHGRGRLMGPSG